jgi:hypothetical protein
MPLSSDNIKAIFDALEDDEDKADYTGSELNTLEVFDAGDDVDLPPPRGLLLGGNQFARGFLSSLIAPGAVGKTSLSERTIRIPCERSRADRPAYLSALSRAHAEPRGRRRRDSPPYPRVSAAPPRRIGRNQRLALLCRA